MKVDVSLLIRRSLVLFLILCVIYYGLLVIGYIIPDSLIMDNWEESVHVINQLEDKRWRVLTGFEATKLDTFTDNLMFQKLLNTENRSPFIAAMWNSGYTRYWMGTSGILRILLLVMNYSGIRYLNVFVIFGLTAFVFAGINRRLGHFHALAFITTLCLIHFWIFPLSLQYSSIYIITLASIFVILLLYDYKQLNLTNVLLLFFVTGSVTNYFDLLTAPLLSFGIPVLIYFGLLNDNKTQTFTHNTVIIIASGIAWGLGYGLTWIANWGISTLVLAENVFLNALNQMFLRTGGGELVSYSTMIESLLSILLPPYSLLPLGMVLLVGIVLVIRSHKLLAEALNLLPLLIIIVLPFLWVFVMRNHSQNHAYFVYRNFALTIYGILMYLALGRKKQTKKVKRPPK